MKETLNSDEYVLHHLTNSTEDAAKISNLLKEIDITLDYIKVNNRKCKYITDDDINLLLRHIEYKKRKTNNFHLFGWYNLVKKIDKRRKLTNKWNINKLKQFYDWENLK